MKQTFLDDEKSRRQFESPINDVSVPLQWRPSQTIGDERGDKPSKNVLFVLRLTCAECYVKVSLVLKLPLESIRTVIGEDATRRTVVNLGGLMRRRRRHTDLIRSLLEVAAATATAVGPRLNLSQSESECFISLPYNCAAHSLAEGEMR